GWPRFAARGDRSNPPRAPCPLVRHALQSSPPERCHILEVRRRSIAPIDGTFHVINRATGRLCKHNIVRAVLRFRQPCQRMLQLESSLALCEQRFSKRRHHRHRHADAHCDDYDDDRRHECYWVLPVKQTKPRLGARPPQRRDDNRQDNREQRVYWTPTWAPDGDTDATD